MKTNCGIYKIINLVTNEKTGICKVYVGSSVDFVDRRYHHFKNLATNKHKNKHLQSSYNRYGRDNFKFEILEHVENTEDKEKLREILCNRETYWVNFYKSNNRKYGYNKRIIVESNLGINHTQRTKNKLSLSHKGKKLSEDHKNNISNSHKGENNHFYGKKHTLESRAKMKESSKNLSLEIKNKIKNSITRKVINLTTEEIFNSIKEAAEYYNLNSSNICSACKGKKGLVGGYKWSYYRLGEDIA